MNLKASDDCAIDDAKRQPDCRRGEKSEEWIDMNGEPGRADRRDAKNGAGRKIKTAADDDER